MKDKLLLEFINSSLELLYRFYKKEGLPEGKNGPYNDTETKARGLAHMLVLISNQTQISPLESKSLGKFHKEIFQELMKFQDKNNPAYFKLRNKAGKDEVNGVIGIAWIIEGLCAYYESTQDAEVLDCIQTIVLTLKFSEKNRLWFIPSTDESLKFDYTLNHQLWLAYAIFYYSKLSKIDIPEIDLFFNGLVKNFKTNRYGRIVHSIPKGSGLKFKFRFLIKKLYLIYLYFSKRQTVDYKESGYQLFNLFALARLKQLNFSHPFFKSDHFNKAVRYGLSQNLFQKLKKDNHEADLFKVNNNYLPFNKYGFPYNVSGFEFVLVNKLFGNKSLTISELDYDYLSFQLNEVFNWDKGELYLETFKSQDNINLLLRTYELTWYLK